MLSAVLTTATAVLVVAMGAANAESNGGVRVMPLGDSINDGTQVPGGYRIGLWQRFSSNGNRIDFVGSQFNGPAGLGDHDHEGHGGWRIDQIDANIVGWMRTFTPRTVLLHIGTNDVAQNRDLPNAPARLSALIDKITNTAPDTYVFVATIIRFPGLDARVNAFNGAIPGIVQQKVNAGRRVHLVQMNPALTAADLIDGVHPTAGGYDKMATVWFNALRSVPGSIEGGTSSSSSSRPASSSSSPGNGGPGGCTAAVATLDQWSSGFVANMRVTAGSSAITGWRVSLTLAPGAALSNTWNAAASGSTGAVTFTNVSYNGAVGAGQSATFGFQGTGSGTGIAPTCTVT
jgi:lysophospholipase L1-like esterase